MHSVSYLVSRSNERKNEDFVDTVGFFPFSHRLRKLDPEEEEDPFNNYEVQSEIKEENFQHVGPHRMSFDSTTFLESGKDFIITPVLSLIFFFHLVCFTLCIFLSCLEDTEIYAILKSIILWHRSISFGTNF